MPRKLADLLSSIPTDEGRSEVLGLGRRIYEFSRTDQRGSEQRELLEALSGRLLWHFRAARYALPTHDELLRMIDEHFG